MTRPRTLPPALSVAFALQFVALDVLSRGARHVLDEPRAGLALAGSGLVWGAAALAVRTRSARILLALTASALLVTELFFFSHYHSFLDLDAALCAKRNWPDVRAIVMRFLPRAALATAVLGAIEYACLARGARAGRRGSGALAIAGLAAFALGPALDRSTPDVSAAGALRALLSPAEARAAGKVVLPKLASTRRKLPSVLFVLTESVREADYCGDPGTPCPTAPETSALLPNRVALHQMRSLASYTAIAANALLGGRMPLGSREEIVSTPLVFDYLHATALGTTRPRVLFWSAQADSLFERSDVRDATDSYVTVESFVGHPIEDLEDVLDQRVDALLAAHVERELPKVEGPFFLMLQLCGTHAPYYVDPAAAPFSPYTRTASWSGLEPLHRAYEDAIHAQDASLARMIRAFLARVGEDPWVVVFTSDHGEAFGEHKAIHHGQNLYDEQIHVPGFVAFGNGALSAAEQAALRAHADDYVTHLDLLPTLLDLYGVLDAFALAPERKKLVGRSLLRPFDGPPQALPATNCTPLFPCPLRNWGVLSGRYELAAQAWDANWRCVDLGTGSSTEVDRPECDALRAASRRFWPTLPNGRDNR